MPRRNGTQSERLRFIFNYRSCLLPIEIAISTPAVFSLPDRDACYTVYGSLQRGEKQSVLILTPEFSNEVQSSHWGRLKFYSA